VLLALRLLVTPEGRAADDAAATGVLRGTLDPATLALPTVTVGDPADLRAMAAAAGRWVVHDASTDRLSYTDGELLYVCVPPETEGLASDSSTAADDAPDDSGRPLDSVATTSQSDESPLDADASGTGEDAAWAALFGDALSEPGGTSAGANTDARPDGGADDAN
jgi:hypothetical protein